MDFGHLESLQAKVFGNLQAVLDIQDIYSCKYKYLKAISRAFLVAVLWSEL